MRYANPRRSALLLLLLLLAGGGWTRGQNIEQQKAADRRFLLHRGIVPANMATPAGSPAASPAAPALRIQAARAQQASHMAAHTSILAQARGVAPKRAVAAAAQPFLNGSTTTWQAAGPVQLSTPAYGLVTGRVSSLAVDPSDSSGNTVYLGATGGGVWKSGNAAGNAGSVTFQPLTDDLQAFQNFPYLPSLSIGALTVNPGNRNQVLAGTGDPNDALDSYYGAGVLRSTDAGTSWTQVYQTSDTSAPYSFVGAGFAGFAWSTTTPNLVVAAVSQSLEGQLVNVGVNSAGAPVGGLYYSRDAGQTWYLSTITDGTNRVLQSASTGAQPPGNPAVSVVWNRQRGMFYAAVRFHGYYGSPDGVTWTRLANQPGTGLSQTSCPANPHFTGSQSCPIFRGVLAVQPATGDMFALTADVNNQDQGLFQDVCSTSGAAVSSCNTGSVTWGTRVNTTALEDGSGLLPEADYNLALSAVASAGDTVLLAGTEDIFRCSLANSCQWRNTTNVNTCAAALVAPSVHAIDGTAGGNGLIFFGTDGGLWRTTDTLSQTGSVCASTDAAHFDNLNGGIGSLAEVSHLAVSPGNGSLVLAGMGALGIAASESAPAQGGTGAWQQLLTGEGSYVAIDPTTPANWYADAFPGVGIYACPNGSNCNMAGFGATPTIGRAQVENDTDYFLDPAPWILDPGNPANILLGSCRMWLGPASGGWSGSNLLSVPLDGFGGSFCNGNAYLRSVGAGGSYNTGGEQMYAGMAGPGDGGGSVPGHVFGATVPQGGGIVSWSDLWRNPVANQTMSQQFNPTGDTISSIAVDPSDSSGKTVYVGIGGFPLGQGGVLYGSLDGGTTWNNLTNTLPVAPVNKVVVDPNNRNYVYVGGDFGVYYTSNIAKCAGRGVAFQNCWAQLGSNLPNAPVTDLQVFNNGGSTVLEASTYGRGIWTLGLTTSSVPAQASLSPGSAGFQASGVGSPSATTASFTLSNTGSVPLAIAQIAVSPVSDYAQTNNCGAALSPGSACAIQVTFTPSTTGDRPGTLTVNANTQTGTLTATLDGTGLTPGFLALNPTAFAFPTTATGSNSAPMTVQVQNTGGAPVQLRARTITGTNSYDFNLGTGTTCGGSLSAGATCTVPVVFSPTQTGTRTAQLQIPSSANVPTVNLSGNAVLPAHLTLTPTSLGFPDTGLGNTASAQSITVQNVAGGAQAQLGTATVSSDYRITNTSCGSVLAGGANCTVNIAFAPTATGTRPGLFTQPSPSIPAGQVTAPLSGNGLPAPNLVLSPAALSFAPQQQGTASPSQSISIANNGGSPAQLGSVVTSNGDFTLTSNNCGAVIAANTSCSVALAFTPTQPNPRAGQLTIPYSGKSETASLSGTGTVPGMLSFNPVSVTFPATADNATSAAQSVTIANTGGNAATINSIAASGPFAVASTNCPVAPQTLPVNASCMLSLTFTPPGAAAYTGGATLTGSFSNAPAVLGLSGQGAAPPNATLSPTSASYPNTPQGSASAPQTFTVTSTGGIAVMLGTPSVSGPDYQISNTNCPASLAPGKSCSLTVLLHPAGTGARAAMLQVPSNSSGGALTASLSGTGTPPGVLTIAPGNLQFGSRVIGSASAPQTATVSNTGGSTITLGTIASAGDFTVASSSCGATLAPASSCMVAVTFSPSVAGDRPGQLTVPGDGAEASAVTLLDGTGTTPGNLVFSPSSLAFGNVATDATATATVTVTNTGGTPVHISGIAASGDFSLAGSGTCNANAPVPANGGACTVRAAFTPSALGGRSGTLTIANDGNPASALEPLGGNGVAPGNLSLAPASIDFGTVVTNSAAPPQQAVTVTNNGGTPITLQAPAVSGSGFTLGSNGCGSSLAAGANCVVEIAFRPTQTGPSPGVFSLTWRDSGSGGGTATTSLQGTGAAPGSLAFAPSPVQFGQVIAGSSSSQQVTVQNSGGVGVALGTPLTSNGFGVINGCGSALASGASCTIQVSFSPAGAGAASGLLTFPASDGSGTQTNWTDALSGTGVLPGALAASPGSLNFPSTVVGTGSASQSVTFSNSGGVSVPLSAPRISSTDYAITNSTCSVSLDPGTSCAVSVAFTPAGTSDRRATLTLASSNGGSPVARIALDGSGLAPAQLVFTPASLAFGGQSEYTFTRAPQTVTLKNTGDVSTTLGLPVLIGQFMVAGSSCGTTLGPGAACAISITFAPTSFGGLSGTLSMASSTGAPSASAALSGTGQALALNPTVYMFEQPLLIGSTSPKPLPYITVQNLDRQTPLTLQPITVTGDFALGISSCGAVLPPDSSCSLAVSFTPAGGGQRTGLLTASSGVETQSTQLVGIGLTPATDHLSTAALTFFSTLVGSKSTAQPVTLMNTGDGQLTQVTVRTTGPFAQTDNCLPNIGGHLSCQISVVFVPTAPGPATGTLVVEDYISNVFHSQTVSLSGDGAGPPQAFLSPASIDYGSYAQNVTTGSQMLTLNNGGATELTNLTVSITGGDFAVSSSTCGSSLAPGFTCQLGVIFTPNAIGTRSGILQVGSSTLSAPLVTSLAGSGEDYSLSVSKPLATAPALPVVVITQGQSADYTLAISPVGESSGDLTISCSGAPANATCTVPATVHLAKNIGFASVPVHVATSVALAVHGKPASRWWAGGAALALLCPVLLVRGETRRRFLVAAVAVLLLGSPIACGVHASGVNSNKTSTQAGQTPTGTYTITVNASFPGAQRAVSMQLVVQ